MRTYFKTSEGKKRSNNQDSMLVCNNNNYLLCAVADGMGGYKAGEVASKIAVDTLKDNFLASSDLDDFNIPTFIRDSIKQANTLIFEESSENEDTKGMGTTITLIIIDENENIAYIGNVGDSRTYVINDKITQITKDHSYVQELVNEGSITDDEAKKHSRRNEITKAVGYSEDIETDIFEMQINKNDIFLLCSDGLTTHLSDEEIFDCIKRNVEESANNLVNIANDCGGTDNITVVIIDTVVEVK